MTTVASRVMAPERLTFDGPPRRLTGMRIWLRGRDLASRRLLWLLTSAVLVWFSPSGVARAGADTVSVPPNVWNEVATNGLARVLVEVYVPQGAFVPEGRLPTLAHILAQRSSLAFAQSQVLVRLQGSGYTLARRFETTPYLALEVDAAALRQLEASGSYVKQIVEDTLSAPLLAQSVPLVEGPQAWAAGFDGTGTVIAFLDTGVDKTHPFLAGKVVGEACFSTPGQGTSGLCPNGQTQQIGNGAGVNCPLNVATCWHGTHVAGIATGNGASAGVAYSGVAKGAKIVSVQVFSRGNTFVQCGLAAPCALTRLSDILAGLEHIFNIHAQHNFAAVNVSAGEGAFAGNCDSYPAKPFIDNLRSVGIATVAAAGNGFSTGQLSAPSCVSTAVSVGSTSKSDTVSNYSNVSGVMSFFAPGEGILSSYPGGAWYTASGTSMSAPHVSGAWAILRQASPGSSVSAIFAALQATGLPVTDDRLTGVFKPRIRVNTALSTLDPDPVAPPAVGRDLNDFNGDGTADILWRHTSGTVSIWSLSGLTLLGTRLYEGVSNDWTIVGAGDFNGDGTADLLWRNSSGAISVWLLSPTSILGTVVYDGVTSDWAIAGVGDFNGDGKADILWRNASGLVAVWLFDGLSVLSTELLGSVATDWTIARVGDFNGDNKADILWRHTSGLAAVWFLDGASLIGSGSLGALGTDWSIEGVGDFNGDGKADILWRHASGANVLWLLDGATVVTSGSLPGLAVEWRVEGVGDINADGNADILWRHTSGTVAAWLLDGLTVLGSGELGSPPLDWQIQ